jgi:hypothetical protein
LGWWLAWGFAGWLRRFPGGAGPGELVLVSVWCCWQPNRWVLGWWFRGCGEGVAVSTRRFPGVAGLVRAR